MANVQGFPPIGRRDARILILGSMPSVESLRKQQYYAHPRNAFWPIMVHLLNTGEGDYRQRTRAVAAGGVAIWDVCRACFRAGSLDSSIDDSTIMPNDFRGFFASHPDIRRVLFNGAKSEQVYRKRVWPTLRPEQQSLDCLRMPSTSPANAGMRFDEKLEAWRRGLDLG